MQSPVCEILLHGISMKTDVEAIVMMKFQSLSEMSNSSLHGHFMQSVLHLKKGAIFDPFFDLKITTSKSF